MNNIQTLKGFRDFLPKEARRREVMVMFLKNAFKSFGFEPLETPALEYEEILMGKYGEEGDKLMYRFEDNGGRRVALRYDQTVPLARVVAQYQNELTMPFKRYQIQPVWRAENTQKGRFREFMQCDIDTVGSSSPLADAEIVLAAARAIDSLGITNFKILISSRNILFNLIEKAGIDQNLAIGIIRTIDKIKKIGREACFAEIESLGVTKEQAETLDRLLQETTYKEDENLSEIMELLKKLNVPNVEFDPYLARGMDYYTGMIFEIELPDYSGGSVGGGGRYDNLIGMFAGKQIPAVGFAFGFDRLLDALQEFASESLKYDAPEALITIFNKDLLPNSLDVYTTFRYKAGIACELYSDDSAKLDKQLKYANQKEITYVVIIGPDEATNNSVVLKNMKTGEQEKLSIEDAIKRLL